jgi:nitrite reductase (NADH) small subunit
MSWIRLAYASDIPLREGRKLRLGSLEIALFNLGDTFAAVENACPHQGGPLADGIVAGTTVVCPLHAWKVCLLTGVVQRPADSAACLKTYPTRLEDGVVWIDIPGLGERQETSDAWRNRSPIYTLSSEDHGLRTTEI